MGHRHTTVLLRRMTTTAVMLEEDIIIAYNKQVSTLRKSLEPLSLLCIYEAMMMYCNESVFIIAWGYGFV